MENSLTPFKRSIQFADKGTVIALLFMLQADIKIFPTRVLPDPSKWQ